MSETFNREEIKNILTELFVVKQLPCPKCEGRGMIVHTEFSYPCYNIGCVEGFFHTPPPPITKERLEEVLSNFTIMQEEFNQVVPPTPVEKEPLPKKRNSIKGIGNV